MRVQKFSNRSIELSSLKIARRSTRRKVGQKDHELQLIQFCAVRPLAEASQELHWRPLLCSKYSLKYQPNKLKTLSRLKVVNLTKRRKNGLVIGNDKEKKEHHFPVCSLSQFVVSIFVPNSLFNWRKYAPKIQDIFTFFFCFHAIKLQQPYQNELL